MSNKTVDRYLESEQYRDSSRCCECGYLRNGVMIPRSLPRTGRCGSCGNDWPCKKHAPYSQSKKRSSSKRKEQHNIRDGVYQATDKPVRFDQDYAQRLLGR